VRSRKAAEPSDGAAPLLWKHAERAWKISGRITPQHIDWYLRIRSGKGLPASFRSRFYAMQIPAETIEATLGSIRRLDDWLPAWSRSAQRFLAESRRENSQNNWQEAAVARRNAAMCYHVAHLVTDDDPRTVRSLRAAGVQAFAQAAQRLMPHTKKVQIPWRASPLPAYLAKPEHHNGELPLVVLLNGATTTKEELLFWADAFLDHGLAVLALDWPGTGEAGHVHKMANDCEDMTDGIIEFAELDEDLEPTKVALVGFSLGGAVAVRSAALDRRIDACITVTSPYDPRVWLGAVNRIVGHQLLSLADSVESLEELAADFALNDVAPRLRCPLLVFGAGRDLVVPPEESLHLAAAVGDLATIVWYPDGMHGLYDLVDDWTSISASWLSALFRRLDETPVESTRVDPPAPADPPPDRIAAFTEEPE
jgi:2,6-dihydroxypseudooxynicotine hydrolase